ncbi:hypothetical protein JKP88DRAFT_307344 [Tribonema minus]|uniref:Tr-type G domain-containing protein n=1 Tax=Tribonema minus TaxID=303371 RepID=A0A835Z5U4_9STRA|nr:hypothetical protein JKP88DRAFT_307344 [Tribonema minus]
MVLQAIIGYKELAKALRVNAKAAFKALGGVRARRKYHLPLQCGPHSFPSLAAAIVPYEDAVKAAAALKREVQYLATEPAPMERRPPRGPPEAPVVVLLGHFNHGKTTLLDALLGPDSRIAAGEACGITQEIRARTVQLLDDADGGGGDGGPAGDVAAAAAGGRNSSSSADGGRSSLDSDANGAATGSGDGGNRSGGGGGSAGGGGGGGGAAAAAAASATFLDTPGQDIFYRMRAGGAEVADLAVVVVSAVDGVCQQTGESIGCLDDLGLPAVVAVTKVDLVAGGGRRRRETKEPFEQSAPHVHVARSLTHACSLATQRVRKLARELHEFVALNGAPVVPVSAVTGAGMDDLRRTISAVLSEQMQAGAAVDIGSSGGGGESESAADVAATGSDACEGTNGVRATGADAADPGGRPAEGAVTAKIAAAAAAAAEPAQASVIDYVTSPQLGARMTLLVHAGALAPGAHFVTGGAWGYIRAVYDEVGGAAAAAPPRRGAAAQVAVKLLGGARQVPLGEPFTVMPAERARTAAHTHRLADALARHASRGRDRAVLEPDAAATVAAALSGAAGGGGGGGRRRFARDDWEWESESESELEEEEEGDVLDEGDEGDWAAGESDADAELALADGAERGVDGDGGASGALRDGERGAEEQGEGEGEGEEEPELLCTPVVLKADTANSLAALLDAIDENRDIQVGAAAAAAQLVYSKRTYRERAPLYGKAKLVAMDMVISAGIGIVTESDVRAADAARCPVFAFNARADAGGRRLARRTRTRLETAPTVQGVLDAIAAFHASETARQTAACR